MNVDHIVPLNHPLVSGLHNEFNLSVIPKEENRMKDNLWWPDMPPYQYEDIKELLKL